MSIIKELKTNKDKALLRTEEEIDSLFSEIKAKNVPVDKDLDLTIRMTLQKVKLQKYYTSKLKEYEIKIVASPKDNKTQKTPEDKTVQTKIVKNSSKTPKKKSKKKKKLIKEVELLQSVPIKAQPKRIVLFDTLAKIDCLVKYLKANKDDNNAVIESWIRKNISNSRLLDYYKTKMHKEFTGYRYVVDRMMSVNAGTYNERMKMRIDSFSQRISSIIGNLGKQEDTIAQTSILGKNNRSSFDILNKKEWILDWNCVSFKRGRVVIYARSDLGLKFKPTEVDAPLSLESFNYLKKYLNDRLPPVRCVIEGLKLSVIDKINFSTAIQYFAQAARQGVIRVKRNGSNIIGSPQQMSFSQALSKAKQMTLDEFKKYKSKYIDFLVSLQSINYKVIPCVERLAHSNSDMMEYAFMFSIECSSGKILIVHENVNPDRSSLLFLVKKESFDKSIRGIYNFLQSAEINKRSSLRDKSIDIEDAGILSYRSINHDDLYSWKLTINTYKRYR